MACQLHRQVPESQRWQLPLTTILLISPDQHSFTPTETKRRQTEMSVFFLGTDKNASVFSQQSAASSSISLFARRSCNKYAVISLVAGGKGVNS